MIVVFKKLSSYAKIPTKGSEQAACFDLYALEHCKIPPFGVSRVKTGIALSIPNGYEGLIRGRSGLTLKGLLVQLGTIDADYRGPCDVMMFNSTSDYYMIKRGDRIAQLAIREIPEINLIETFQELPKTARNENGFGSTGV